MLYVLLPLKFNRQPPMVMQVFRWIRTIQPWSMMEVFLMGILVLDRQAGQDGQDRAGYGRVCLPGADLCHGGVALRRWTRTWCGTGGGATDERCRRTTADKAGLISCHSCHLLCRRPQAAGARTLNCPRCGAALHPRKPNSIARTWALVMAAFIFYIPANLLPITKVISLGQAQSDTIMSGVIYFIHSGMWPIALVIFVASVVRPAAETC